MDKETMNIDVNVEEISNIERKLAVGLPWPRVKEKLDEAYSDLGKGVQIKGFRRGKVPRGMLEKMFGKHVHLEVADKLVRGSLFEALKEKDINPVSEPSNVEDDGIKEGEEFRYSVVFQVLPEIEPKDYFGVEVEQTEAVLQEGMVDNELARMQNEHTEYLPIEDRVTAESDVLLIDVFGKVGGEPVSMDNKLVELAGGQEPIAGIREKLVGIPADSKELDLEFDVAAEEGAEDQEPKAAQLLVTIKDAKEKRVPALDDEFAKDTGDAETLAELKASVEKRLLEDVEKRERQVAQESLMDKLLEVNDVPVVPALVERQLEQMSQYSLQLYQSLNLGEADMAQIKEGMRPNAEKSVRGVLLLEAIGKKEKIEVTDEDVDARIEEIAKSQNVSADKVRSQIEQSGNLEGIKKGISETKTTELLMSKAVVTMVPPKTEEELKEEGEDSKDA